MPSVSCLSDNDRFHGFKIDYADRSIAHAISNNQITQEDADLIRTFIAERRITQGISLKRSLKITSNLVTVRRFIPPFKELTISQLYCGIENLKIGLSSRDKPFSLNTRIDLLSILKQFSLWLIENGEISIPEKKVKSIKIPNKIPTKQVSDLLSSYEISALMAACENSRDRALIMTLYEGGFRIGEMKWGALQFDGTGVIVNVTFKTGQLRYIRLVMSKEHLIKWKSDYPKEITEDSFVFLNKNKKHLTYGAIYRQIDRLSKRAHISKHITPHIFRHSRITHLLQQGVSESVVQLMMWGHVYSKSFPIYAHLAGTDIDREIYKLSRINLLQLRSPVKPPDPRYALTVMRSTVQCRGIVTFAAKVFMIL